MADFIHSVKSCLCRLHGVPHVDLIETHISWVFLTGSIVYKVKKPVDLGFVNFTTLEKRRHFCFEELRLNKRLAPDLYIDVVTITGDNSHVEIDGQNNVIDYAVRLKQFRQEDQFDNLINSHNLTLEHITKLAHIIAEFHNSIDTAPADSQYGEPDTINAACVENFRHCRKLLTNDEDLKRINLLENWTNQEFTRLLSTFKSRKADRKIRECHGDLHLRNITLYQGKITPFDCIEFNPDFRWIDVISEAAFLIMDLTSRGRQDFAVAFLNEYLTITGDYSGISCLRYYLVYRSMVRAKVEIIRTMQTARQPNQQKTAMSDFYHYLDLAASFSKTKQPLLIITHGLSGSGKSTIAKRLQEQLFIIHLRSDVERKRLYKLQATAKSHSNIAAGIYTQQATEQTYNRLAMLAETLIQEKWNVIVDATFLHKKDRQYMHKLAVRNNARYIILDCKALESSLKQRVIARELQSHAVSEATLSVLEHQLSSSEPLSDEELSYCVSVDTDQPVDFESLAYVITHKSS